MSTFNIKKILVPVDFSDAGEKAINQAIYLGGMNSAAITLLHIVDSPANTYGPDYLGASKVFRQEFETMLYDAIRTKMDELKKELIRKALPTLIILLRAVKCTKK